MSSTVVLVHGAWHGAWCWEQVIPLLDDAGVPSIAFDLPGHGESTQPLGDLAGDAAALRGVLDTLAIDGDGAIVCAHSYGGCVASEGAAGHPAVRHLVYLAAFPLAVGEAATSAATSVAEPEDAATDLVDAFHAHDDGTVTLEGDTVIGALYGDCDADVAAKAAARLCPQAWAELHGVATQAAWETIPSTYVVCAQDRAVAPSLQRVLAQRCTRTIEWPTSHSPFLSRPDLVAELLAELADS